MGGAVVLSLSFPTARFAFAVPSTQNDETVKRLIRALDADDVDTVLRGLTEVGEKTAYEPELLAPVASLLLHENERVRQAAAGIIFALARLTGCFVGDAGAKCGLMIDVYDKLPVATETVRPNYPPAGRRQQLDADVQLKVLVDVRGRVAEAEILEPVFDFFAVPAVEAAKKWRFEPAEIDGTAVPIVGVVTTTFRIN